MRLPLIDPADLTAEQRPLYEDMKAGIAQKFNAFETVGEDGALIGPWNPWLHEPVIGKGYGNEAAEVGRCLRAGLLESPLVPHAQTLTLMRQMEELRRLTGIRYPGE